MEPTLLKVLLERKIFRSGTEIEVNIPVSNFNNAKQVKGQIYKVTRVGVTKSGRFQILAAHPDTDEPVKFWESAIVAVDGMSIPGLAASYDLDERGNCTLKPLEPGKRRPGRPRKIRVDAVGA